MNVALYGAGGKTGMRISRELTTRGHQVVAIVRDPSKLAASEGVTVKQDDLSSAAKTAQAIEGTDAVVSAYGPPLGDTGQLIVATRVLIDAVRSSGVPRLIVVGGAGSLEIAPGVTLLSSGHLPEAWKAIAESHDETLKMLRQCDIDWTYFSPAAYFEPGTRTGRFRLGRDELIRDERGESRISLEDYAIALVDELEKPENRKRRFTIGY